MDASIGSGERWSSFEPRPSIVCAGEQTSWSGAQFHEIVSPRFGSFDSGERGGRFMLLCWTLGPLRVRYGAKRSFQTVPRRPVVFMPGDAERGEWEGVETSLLTYLPGRFIEQTVGVSADLARPKLRDEHLTKIEHLVQLIRADVRASSPAGSTVGESLLAGLAGAIFPDDERTIALQHERGQRIVARLVEYIEANLGEPLSLVQIAAQADISVRHMSRAFKASTGMAPHDYVVKRRVNKATELIREGELSLVDIAISVGFSSHAHMAAAFRRVGQRAPSLFRNT
jgi:AraC-like DNA-binding protein